MLIDDAADSAASAEPAVDPSTAADLPDDADLSDSEDVAVDPSAGGEPTDGDLETATQTARIDRAALEAALQRTAPVGEWTTAQFQDELVDIDVALAGMLSRQTSEWNLQPLLDRAEAAIGHAHNSIERGRARLLVKKIKNFDDLARRSQLIARGQTGDGSRSAQQPAAGHDPRTSSLDRRYDGVGRLTPVYSRRLGAPDYALVDDQGKVRCYVTAAPGVNLRNYVGKTVGVTGTLGYAAELSSQHLTAQRVTAIDAPVLR